MKKRLVFILIFATSLTFFNMTDCGSGGTGYASYVSFGSGGRNLKVILRQGTYSAVADCSYNRDGKQDTATFSCTKVDGDKYDTTVIFTDSTIVAIDGERLLCQHFESRYLDLWQTVMAVESLEVGSAMGETLNLWGAFNYPTDTTYNGCNDTDFDTYEISLRFYVRSDSPYVWIKPFGYDSLFVSPETVAHLIEEPFPFVKTDSFHLNRRRIVKLHKGKFYHYGAVELVPGSDSVGWATLRVSFSVVPRLGWTLPPVDTSL